MQLYLGDKIFLAIINAEHVQIFLNNGAKWEELAPNIWNDLEAKTWTDIEHYKYDI